MQSNIGKSRWLLLLAVLGVLAAACGPSATTTTGAGATTTAGTGGSTTTGAPAAYCDGAGEGNLIWAHEQEPPDLHLDDPANNLTITSWIRQSLLDGLYGISAETTFIPELLASEATMADNGDGTFTASYTLRDGLVWSDGDDLTADDVKFTLDFIMATGPDGDDEGTDPDFIYQIGDRTGYDTITNFTVNSPTEFTITWSAFFAGWRDLFLDAVYPSHVFATDPAAAAAELNTALREWKLADGTVIPSSGPMMFSSWERGVTMELVRNDAYNGSNSADTVNKGAACVSGVTINFVTDTDAQVNALKAGEAHMIFTQPQLQFKELADDANFTIASLAGPVFEHWGLNVSNVHLAKPEVREAVALAFNKEQVMTTLYTPLFADLLPTAGLGNTYWMSNQPQYVDHQGEAGYGKGDAAAAKAKLEGVGYVLGADGVYEHPTDGRLTLRNGTTGGNQLREQQQQIIQAQMKDAGIEIVIENRPGSEYFDIPFGGDPTIWEITQFAWVGGPWPGGQSASYRTGSGNNPYEYANDAFDAKADECDGTVDQTAQDTCYSDLDVFVTTLGPDGSSGLFMIPITQKPSFYAYSNTLLSDGAVGPDADGAGPLVNSVDYKLAAA